ncbi:MAG: aminotransferase class IV [Phycisphaeraceae bacterium]|nr:aminotransferase class IV [Phycisphaeraceae bacterium]
MILHLNGQLVAREHARIDPLDRGFLFGDGLYEGLRAFDAVVYGLDLHVERMRSGLEESRIDGFDASSLGKLSEELLDANHLRDAFVYWQITRGSPAPGTPAAHLRKRIPGDEISRPTVMGYCVPLPGIGACVGPKAIHAAIVEDTRWTRCHIKSISLMGNVLHALEAAHAPEPADDSIMARGGVVSEASSTNLFASIGGRIVTPPVDRGWNLRGVTRAKILRRVPGIEVRDITVDQLRAADEIMLAGTITMVAGVTRLDGRAVGDGRPGPACRTLYDALVGDIRDEIASARVSALA